VLLKKLAICVVVVTSFFNFPYAFHGTVANHQRWIGSETRLHGVWSRDRLKVDSLDGGG
jgi:hypothetical protein